MPVVIVRAVILYATVTVIMRLLGKRQIGELEPSELVVTIMLSELAAIPLQDMGMPLVSGVLPILLLLCFELIASYTIFRSPYARRILCGSSNIVIQDGRFVQRELEKQRITAEEIIEKLRLAGESDLRGIKHAFLETDGNLSYIKYEQSPAPQSTEPFFTIVDRGRMISQNLLTAGLTETWVLQEIKKGGGRGQKDVYFMNANKNREFSLFLKEK